MTKISRRNLLKAAGAGSVAAAFGGGTRGTGFNALIAAAAPKDGPDELAPWFEASIPDLQALMTSGELTSRELTQAYLAADRSIEPVARRRHRNQPTGGRNRRPARWRTQGRAHAWSAARHPNLAERQHRHRRRDGDDCRVIGAGREHAFLRILR